jgi:hypothetical protein
MEQQAEYDNIRQLEDLANRLPAAKEDAPSDREK